MANYQSYCSVKDLVASLGVAGFSTDVLNDAILPASDYVRREIGNFIPRTYTHVTEGSNTWRLFLPPVVEITSIVNDGTTLSATDYVPEPVNAHWPDGPYTWLSISDEATHLACWLDTEITGKFGLYNVTRDSGAVIGTGGITGSATSLLVSDGSKVSPGHILLIGSEQLFVSGVGSVTAAVTTTSASLDNSSETVSVSDGTKIKVGEVIRIEFEQMAVLDIQSNTAYVARGWNGTRKTTHTSSSNVDVYRTFSVERGVNGTTAASHSAGDTIYLYTVPQQVNYLTRQIAALMLKKAQSGFAGKTGNATVGDVYYFHEFPRDEIARIKSNFYVPRSYA